MESGSRISYTRTLEEQTLVYLSVSPPNLSMMLVWNNLADPHLSVFSDFARFSQTLTLKQPRCQEKAIFKFGFPSSIADFSKEHHSSSSRSFLLLVEKQYWLV